MGKNIFPRIPYQTFLCISLAKTGSTGLLCQRGVGFLNYKQLEENISHHSYELICICAICLPVPL